MTNLRPRSILQLTIISFLAVVAPLIAALVIIAQQLGSLSEYSQSTISEAALAMRTSRALIEQTSAMERNARQYGVLGDEELLRVYMNRRNDLIDSVNILNKSNVSNDIKLLSSELVEEEEKIFNVLQRDPARIASNSDLPVLIDLSYKISRSINEWTDRQVMLLRRQADRTLYLLQIEALALIGVAIVLAGTFTALITRPLRQIDRAIHQIGKGSFDTSIDIQGPRDLQGLGVRLNWLRNRLRELEQQRSRFLRHVSHELKTPLTAIQEGTALLGEGLAGSLTRQQSEIINILGKNCRRLQHLIEDLLRLKTNDPGSIYSMPQPLRFDKVINKVIDDQILAIKSHQLTVSLNLREITVYGDEEQLRAVVDNLLTNAIKYSPKGGTIYIQLECEEDHAVFDIRDEGRGISSHEHDRIFEAFYQGRPSDKEHMRGTGLGLTIAAEYTQMNGGTIEVLDSATGANFRVRIPLRKENS